MKANKTCPICGNKKIQNGNSSKFIPSEIYTYVGDKRGNFNYDNPDVISKVYYCSKGHIWGEIINRW